MSVSATSPRIEYAGNGSQTAFSIPFAILAPGDLAVYSGATKLTLSTDYTISGTTLTFAVAPASGVITTLVRAMSFSRPSDYQTAGSFTAAAINADLDARVLADQQIQEQANRSIRLAQGSAFQGESLEIVQNGAARASKIIGFDGSGNTTLYDTFLAVPVALAGNAFNLIRVNAAGTGYELRTPTQTRTDIAAQPVDATLTGLSGQPVVANELIYSTGVNTFAMAAFPAYARTLVSQPDAPSARTTLGLGSIATHDTADFVSTSTLGANSGTATLDSSGKLTSSQIPASLVGALQYQGAWNASTNSPTLVSSSGTKGQFYIVSTAGTTTLDGISSWSVRDWAVYDGSKWEIVQGGISSGEVTAALGFTPLAPANNLSEVSTPATALSNIGGVGPATTNTLTGKTYDTAGTGNLFKINGTTISSVVGAGAVVLATSPTLVTPALGAATATSINGLTITPSTGTLTVANLKTLTFNNALTLAGTDGTTITFQGTDTYVGRTTTDTFTNKTFDTAGTGNSFKIAGTSISAVTGTGSTVVLSTAPTFTTQIATPYIATGSSGGNKTILTMTSNGAKYGTIQVENAAGNGSWSLGYQSAAGSVIGTPALTWDGGGNVTIAGLLSSSTGSFSGTITGPDSGTWASGGFTTTGNVQATNLIVNGGGLIHSSIGRFSPGASTGKMIFTNSAVTAGVLIDVSTDGTMKFRNRADTADATITAGALTLSGALTYGGTTLVASISGSGGALVASNSPTLSSPSLTGTPVAPTATGGTNTTQIATTAFVTAAISASGGGTVSSVSISGGTTGLTTSGGPITSSGTITLAGTLAVANGGTGVTSSTGTGSNVLSASPTFTGTISAAAASLSGTLSTTQVAETYTAPTISAGTLTIDISTGTVFKVANSANISTFTINNATASKASSFTLILAANGTGYTQAWGSVKWAGGTAPTITTTNAKKDILTFATDDGGTTWYGFVAGQNF